jgi:Penicillinase repressor
MDAIWSADGPLSVREVLETLNRGRAEPLAYTTVMTVMNRLAAKRALERRGEPRSYVYAATGKRGRDRCWRCDPHLRGRRGGASRRSGARRSGCHASLAGAPRGAHVRLDRVNRTFLASALAAWMLGGYVICGAVAGALLHAAVMHVSRDGWRSLGSVSMMLTFLLLTIAGIGVARSCHVLARQILVCRRLAQRTRQFAARQPDGLARVAGAAGLTGRVVLIGEPDSFRSFMVCCVRGSS